MRKDYVPLIEHTKLLLSQGLTALHKNNYKRKPQLCLEGQQIRHYTNNLHLNQKTFTLAKKISHVKRQDLSRLFNNQEENLSEQLPVLFPTIRSKQAISSIANMAFQKNNCDTKNMLRLARQIYQGTYRVASGEPLEHIIHLGAGGSMLGPQLLYTALNHTLGARQRQITVDFLSSVDGSPLAHALATRNPKRTLIIVNSKSFTTQETLQNFSMISSWKKTLSEKDIIAITAYPDRARALNIKTIFSYPTWLGGRYSIFSPVSFILPALFGKKAYQSLLEGAHDQDQFSLKNKYDKNPSFRMALMDFIYHSLLKWPTRAVFIYDTRLQLLLPYLQQLEMESNSKSITIDNKPVPHPTTPILWGGVGSDSQHSLFQTLYQGTHLFPTEFITVQEPQHKYHDNHRWLLAHAKAQQIALREGYNHSNPVYQCGGNKPSSHIQLQTLSAYTLGALISYYELRTYLLGKLLNINSFDQMGVNFAKPIARKLFTTNTQ